MKTKISSILVIAMAVLSLSSCQDKPMMLSPLEFEHLSFTAEQATIEVDKNTVQISIAAAFDLLQHEGHTDAGFGGAGYTIDAENSTAVEGTHYKSEQLTRKSEGDKHLYFANVIGENITKPVTLTIKLTEVDKYPNPSKLPVISKISITLMPKK